MVKFDVESALTSQSQSGNLLEAVGSGFGAPTCLTKLFGDALSLLPFPILAEMNAAAEEAQEAMDKWNENLTDINLGLGISISITPNGQISIKSRNSKFGMGIPGIGALGAIGGYLNGAAQLGAGLYATAMGAIAQFEAAKDCVEGYFNQQKFAGTNSSVVQQQLSASAFNALVNKKLGPKMAEIKIIEAERQKWSDLQDRIEQEMANRLADPSLEPLLDCSLSGLGFNTVCEVEPEEEKEIIRLVYGPPVAKEGQFIISNDGLYYDSQTPQASGVVQVLEHLNKSKSNVPIEDRWRFEHDANLGGKGVPMSSKSVRYYVDTLFDPTIIDETGALRAYYEKDHYLKTLESQKTKRVYDLSSHIEEFEQGGASTAIIQNTKQSVYSEISLFTHRINKRKKQIELAVKMPTIYGSGPLFSPGEVPVNDFSYLQQFNFANDIHKQKALVLDQADVTGVVSPIVPKYVVSKQKDEVENMEHLFVADIGRGEILYSNSASSTVAPKLHLTSRISTNGLFAVYNFLESNIVATSSSEFNVTNCAVEEVYNNAQLLGNHTSSVFVSGLSIPYLRGVTQQIEEHPFYASSLGSVVRLPETQEFDDLTYKIEGFTFESWMYVPDLTNVSRGWTDNSASSLYRLVLANENTGLDPGITAQTDPERIDIDLGDAATKGMIMGFTRDRRLTKSLEYSINNHDNLPTSSLAFFAAPTQAINNASAALIHNGCSHDVTPNWYSFTVDASTVNSKGQALLLSGTNQFILASLVVEPVKDKISLYVNGDLLTTSSLESSYGRDKYNTPSVPSFKKATSFSYSGTNVGTSATAEITEGPRLGSYFTPTLLGGGYTDGIAGTGFMGNETFGAISGLRGYLGSVKFYDRALTDGEVETNYNAQKEVFENISTPSTYTEDGS